MRDDALTASRIRKAESAVSRAIQWTREILTDEGIRRSRLSKKVDFYSFIGALMELLRQKTLSSNSLYNRSARRAVKSALGKLAKVDGRVARYAFRALPSRERRLAEYIVATREATDQLRNRQIRHDFWYSILAPCFPKRLAAKRLFGKDLKNALWNAAKVQYGRMSCPNPDGREDCWGRISYEQAVVDHRKAYSRGGASSMSNGQLMCVVCNSGKGAK
jgi:5-methylcytosine-specific restriction endonuclease McrA